MKKEIAVTAMIVAAFTISTIQALGGEKKDSAELLFKTKCSKCHSAEMPLHMKKDPKGWEISVKKMQSKDQKWISDKDAKEIVEFLVSRSKEQSK